MNAREGWNGMGDHRLDFAKVDLNDAVIKRALFGLELLIGFRAAVDGEVFLNLLIRLPDGGEAGRLGGHDVDADAVVHREAGDAGPANSRTLFLTKPQS